jgi:ATP-dependent exoDNAse (exonuclease V) beta subunit
MPTLISEKWESAKDHAPQIPLPPDDCKTAEEVKKKREELKMSDAVKVMYVGMTRARRELYLSFVDMAKNKAKKPTKFIADFLDDENVCFEIAPAYTEESYAEGERKLIEQRPYDYEADFKALIDGYFENHVFSVSDINEYNACPRQYLYSNILELSGKDGNPDALSFGSAVHKALEKAVAYAKENHVWCEEDELIDYFKKALKHLPTQTVSTRRTLEKRGEKALRTYYDILIETKPAALKETELMIEFNESFPFIGFIDRIDKNNGGTVTIYDYKTGKAKKETDISPNGEYADYYRQMCVYKYVYEKITGKKVQETTFIFVEEPDENVTLSLTDKDCEDAWKAFKETVKEMKKGHFEPTENEDACEYCALSEFCQRNRV